MTPDPNLDRNPATKIGRTVIISRLFAAPPEAVFDAWINPKALAQWWGPECFTTPVCDVDARPGGKLYLEMHGPDGGIYPMRGTYRDVATPGRLVFESEALEDGEPILATLTTVTIEPHDGGSALKVRAVLTMAKPEAAPHLEGMGEGWDQTVSCLGAYLEKQYPAGPVAPRGEITSTRLIDAPRERVFEAWTRPEQIARWWGPRGFTNTITKMDVRPGGEWRFVMHGPDGTEFNNRSVYREVVAPERLSYTHESGPAFEADITFAEEAGKTRLTMRMIFGSEELRHQDAVKSKAVEGQGQTLDKLEEFLANSLND